jgi:hypothetical protein
VGLIAIFTCVISREPEGVRPRGGYHCARHRISYPYGYTSLECSMDGCGVGVGGAVGAFWWVGRFGGRGDLIGS